MRIIDGYNVIGAAGAFGISLSQPDKEDRLLRLLARFGSRRRRRAPTLVVFDGHHGRLATGPRRETRLGIDVEWAIGESADALIERRVRASSRARQIEVVTSDAAVLRAVASWGAAGTRSPDFLAEVARCLADAPEAEKPEAPAEADVAEWLKLFGDGR